MRLATRIYVIGKEEPVIDIDFRDGQFRKPDEVLISSLRQYDIVGFVDIYFHEKARKYNAVIKIVPRSEIDKEINSRLERKAG